MLSLLDLYWLAGLLEGEGSFNLSKRPNTVYPRISLTMDDEDIVKRCQAIAGVGSVYHQGPYKNAPKGRWAWQVVAQADAAGLMMTLYTLMGQRRQEQIRRALGAWRAQPVIRSSR